MSGGSAATRRWMLPFARLEAPDATAFLAPALAAWRRALLALCVIGVLHTLLGRHLRGLTEQFFYLQDLPVAGLMLLLLSGLYLVRPAWAPRPLSGAWRTAGLMAVAVGAFAWSGTFLVYDNFALSMDEFMARFDAQIFAAGRLAAPVPVEWREYVSALQPMFAVYAPGNAYWYSGYLPVNAGFLLASRAGAQSLMPPLWAAIAVLTTFGVARRLWPERPGAALVAAMLLATTPQLLITAMTPYAMSAHLALNMLWLWLVLRGGRLGHGVAAPVAFLATGLHQIVFHPLFAAPFVLELWLARRWKPALWHTCAFAAIGLTWMLYPALRLASLGAPAPDAASPGMNALAQALDLLSAFDLSGLGLMAKNLVRFATWQSLLTIPLALTAAVPAIRAGGMLRALALSVVLTTTAMLVLLPYQGHGWGYRYLHGLMGAVCLLAAWGWMRFASSPPAPVSSAARRAVLVTAAAASVLVLLPIRAWQTHAFTHPYAVAASEIQRMDAAVLLVDNAGVAFGADLVRNDPFLRQRPVVLHSSSLTVQQLHAISERPAAEWFRPADAARTGIPTGTPALDRANHNRAVAPSER